MKRSEINQLFRGNDPATVSLLPVLDQFHEGVMITDSRGVVLYMNEAQARIDDLSIGDAIGRTVSDLYRVDEGSSPAMTCLRTGRAIENLACYYRTRLGRVVNSIHNVYPLLAHGRVMGVVCIITDYKNLEQTVAAIGRSGPPRSIETAGFFQGGNRIQSKGNGTRYAFGDVIGADADLLAAVKTARLASESPSPVMIFGETGTGKEMIAQSIHNQSPRKNRPFVAINCAAIPENLMEGMLFGTSKGAFTGAIDKAGLLETADGSTLFLDEINSMSPGLQAKLLRFLQERKVRRIGAMQEIDVELKVVSSVNAPPHAAIEAGTLRADLFYRLAVVFISIPPLRARKSDLDRLTAHFLAAANGHLGKRVEGLAMDVRNRFQRCDWPGNVRQLAHVIEGAMNMVGDEKTIEMHHLAVPLQFEGAPQPIRAHGWPADRLNNDRARIVFPSFSEKSQSPARSLNQIKIENEISAIEAALTASGGNAARAARRLGISPQLMHYKLKRFGIDRLRFKTD